MQRTTLLVITFMTVCFAPLIEGGTTQLPVLILHLLVLSMLAVWLVDGYKNGRLSLHGSGIDIPAIAFFAASLVSATIAPYKYMALIWVQLIFYYLLFFFLSREALYVKSKSHFLLLKKVDKETLPDETRSDEPVGNPPSPPFVKGGMEGIYFAVRLVLGMGAVESLWGLSQRLYDMGRPTGSFFNPDMLAGYLAPPCLLAVSLAVFGRATATGGTSIVARRGRLALLISLASLCLVVIILTGSRGGVLALSAGALVVLWARFGRRSLVLVAAAVALVLLVPNPVRDRVMSHSQDPFAYSRTGIWKSSLEMIRDHPQGVGAGNFKYVFTRYNFPVKEAVIKYGKVAATAHNEYLHVGAEMGILGLLVLIAGVVLLAGTLKKSIRLDNPPNHPLIEGGEGRFGGCEYKGLAVGLAGGITAVFVHALVDANLHEPGIVFLLILLVSLALRISGGASREITLAGGSGRGRLILYAALIAILAIYAAMPAAAYYFSSKSKAEARSGDMKSAVADVDRSLLIEPGNASYHSQKAALSFTLYQKGGGREDFTGAVDGLEEAIRLNPNDVSYELLISRIEYGYGAALPVSAERTRYLESALGHAKRAVELAPDSAEALLGQARAHMALGDAGNAAAVLEALRAAEPNCLRGRLMLAQVYRALGKTDLSRREYYNIIERAGALKGASLSPEEKEFVKVDQAGLDELGKNLGVLH